MPPIVPAASVRALPPTRSWDGSADVPPLTLLSQNGIDTINFRTLRESRSLDLDNQIVAVAGSKSAAEGHDESDVVVADPFDGFTSVTLHHDGDA
jgi:protein-serine/threonine kinase